jgi:hypothetical protein
MPAKATQKLDGAALLKKLTAGFETKPTKRRGKEGFVLVQHNGRTLAMASINTGAVRLEGNRLDKNMMIIDVKGVEKGRRAIDAVKEENLAKARERDERKAARTSQPQGRPSGGNSVAAKRVEQPKAEAPAPSGKRARNHTPARGEVIA